MFDVFVLYSDSLLGGGTYTSYWKTGETNVSVIKYDDEWIASSIIFSDSPIGCMLIISDPEKGGACLDQPFSLDLAQRYNPCIKLINRGDFTWKWEVDIYRQITQGTTQFLSWDNVVVLPAHRDDTIVFPKIDSTVSKLGIEMNLDNFNNTKDLDGAVFLCEFMVQ